MNKRMIEKAIRLQKAQKDVLGYDIARAIEHHYKGQIVTYVDADKIILPILREFLIYKQIKKKPTPVLYRLSLPLFIVVMIVLLFIVMPVKWCFTGRYSFRSINNKFVAFMEKWWDIYFE